jgi:hypothetical protein
MPWMKFYPSDWKGDSALRTCSVAARGVWIDILCAMHTSAKRGYLILPTGAPMHAGHIARMIGIPEAEMLPLLTELEQAGVFSRDANGAIYSRRMVRDETVLQTNRANGSLGGNPMLRRGDNPPDNPPDNSGDKARSQKSDVRSQKSEGFTESLVTENPKHNQYRNSAPHRAKPRRDAAPRITWGKDGFANIGEDMQSAWKAAYPACDITRELAKAHAWLVANPTRTKTDYRRFLTSWLSRAQDRGGSQPYQRGNPIPEDIPF